MGTCYITAGLTKNICCNIILCCLQYAWLGQSIYQVGEKLFLKVSMRNVISLVVLLCSFTSADTQPTLDKVIDKYFRVNPLNRPFHLFLSQVINDTAFTIARLEKRTDTSLFYMQGNYKNFNPFSFKTQVVQLIIADYIVKDDSSQKNIDTLITCRISATTLPAAGKYQKEQVRNEYKVFTRKNQRLFIFKIDSSHT